MKSHILAMALMCASTWADAQEFSVLLPAKSSITFVSRQMGVPVNGKFGKFSARIAFDPDKTAANQAHVDIDMASIDAGSDDANGEVKGKEWFSIKEYPLAQFESSGFKALGGGRYEAAGKLTIRNVTRNVVIPFTARIEGGTAMLEGGLAISRQVFAIGSGAWADTSIVADEVQLRFRVVLGQPGK